MTPALNFSANYGRSYRAPRLEEISGPQSMTTAPLGAPDPFRGNQPILYPVDLVFGPNFHLKPETGDSLALGLQFTTYEQPGFRASLNWYSINITNYIGAQQFEAILQNPDIFPGAVVRAPPSAADQQQGFLGPIIQFNDTFFNFGGLHVKGFDADLRYSLDTRIGAFTPSLALANLYEWSSALAPQLPPVDGLSRATLRGVGWAPRWKGTAALTWQQGPLAVHFVGRYIGRYLDYQDLVANSNEIGNSWIFDMHARWDVPRVQVGRASWLTGSYIALGVVDLFDRTPPFSYNPNWYDTQQYDLRGRFIRLTAGLQF
jgi:iron complex outermembrane receptor protein